MHKNKRIIKRAETFKNAVWNNHMSMQHFLLWDIPYLICPLSAEQKQ